MDERALTCLADFESTGELDVESHLSDLAVDGGVAPSTQNRAFHALLKFFKLVLKRDMGRIEAIRATKGTFVPMPDQLIDPLRRWVASREVLHRHDLADGTASEWLPHALDRKYPSAHRELGWQFLFASDRLSRDPRTGRLHRHHIHMDTFPKHLRRAVQRSGLVKRITSHTFRHCFATHMLWQGTDIREIQRLLGHSDVKTTEIYTHVHNPDESKTVSPLDRMMAVA